MIHSLQCTDTAFMDPNAALGSFVLGFDQSSEPVLVRNSRIHVHDQLLHTRSFETRLNQFRHSQNSFLGSCCILMCAFYIFVCFQCNHVLFPWYFVLSYLWTFLESLTSIQFRP